MTPDVFIRRLDPSADRALVDDLFHRSADYVALERGEDPSPVLSAEFFDETVPGGTLDEALKLGLFVGPEIVAIADVGFGFPDPGDAYLGLMQFAQEARGRGLGAVFLRHVEAAARARGATRLYLAVLEENPRGRAFWDREGFSVVIERKPHRLGQKDHLVARMVKGL